MNRWLVLVSILLCFTAAQSILFSSFGKCSYTGDPHVIPFPTSFGQVTNMYFCQKTGWEILLQNKWVYILVKVGPSPYVILDYVVVFYNATQDISCVLIGSSGLSTCASSSSIVSITSLGGTSWNHWYPNAQYFDLQITSFPWGTGKRYDFIIRQTFDLINQSTGVCIKHDCPLEKILSPPPPIIIKICDTYIASAQQRRIGVINENIIRPITIACQNDVLLSFNPKLAQTVVGYLIHSSLDQIDGENYQNGVIKAAENIKAALLEADRTVAALIATEDTCSDQKRCFNTDDE